MAKYISVTYSPDVIQQTLSGIEVPDIVEVDDSIVLEGSMALTGVRVRLPDGVLKCEVFLNGRVEDRWLEIYPLDGKDDPIEVFCTIIGSHSIHEEDVLQGVIEAAFHQLHTPEPEALVGV